MAASMDWRETGTLPLIKLAAEALRENPTVYDIGANVGDWTKLMLSIRPDTRIEAFEPLKQHQDSFHQMIGHDPRVSLHGVGVGPEKTNQPLHVTDFSDASSLLPPTTLLTGEYQVAIDQTTTIQVVNLDQYVQERGLPLPDLIKLDIQGYELEALRGADLCLDHSRWILMEASFKEYYCGQPLITDVIHFMNSKGYRLIAISGDGVKGVLTQQADLLFLRDSE